MISRTSAKRTGALTVFAVALFAGFISPAEAQSTRERDRNRSEERWTEERPIAPTPLEEARRAEAAILEGELQQRGGLLREGSSVLEVSATLHWDEEGKVWIARLLPREEQTPAMTALPEEMRMAPNSFLTEIEQVIEATPNQRITLELTGETLVYQRQNYLLLRAPGRVIGLERIEDEGTGRGDALEEAPDEVRSSPRGGRTAAEVMRELESESGPLHRVPIVPRAPEDRDRAEVVSGDDNEPVGGTTAGADRERDMRQWREGTMLMQRRGRIVREESGRWQFVLDADVQNLADPPLTLVPCLLLERIERFARQAGPTAAVLISGEVFVHGGRTYLLPSAFQLPRERTPLN